MSPSADRALVVVRFSPFTREGLEKSIEKQRIGDEIKGRNPRHGISVFGDYVQDGEDIDGAVLRICNLARGKAGGPKIVALLESALIEAGYAVHPAVPPDNHYLIGGKDLHQAAPPLDDLVDMLASSNRRKNPSNEEGTGTT